MPSFQPHRWAELDKARLERGKARVLGERILERASAVTSRLEREALDPFSLVQARQAWWVLGEEISEQLPVEASRLERAALVFYRLVRAREAWALERAVPDLFSLVLAREAWVLGEEIS